ncbi:MAG: hypothetical protein Kow00103_01350 [Candidatus Caldatribacteriota bacterium]
MRISCTSFSFNKDIVNGNKNLEIFFKICKKLNISEVEIWDEHTKNYTIEDFRRLKELINKYNLKLITFAVNNHDFTSKNQDIRNKDIEQVNKWIEISNLLECKILRVLPGNLIELNNEKDILLPHTLASFEKCLKNAIINNIVLAIENCPRETDPGVIIEIVKYFNSKNLMLCPDIGNIKPEIRYAAFESLLPWAVHIHAKTYDFDKNGNESTIDYYKVLDIIKKYNFNGCISIEYEGDKDELWGVEKSISLIRKIMSFV